jgi:hypothetical protein
MAVRSCPFGAERDDVKRKCRDKRRKLLKADDIYNQQICPIYYLRYAILDLSSEKKEKRDLLGSRFLFLSSG